MQRFNKPACLLVLGIVIGVRIFFWQNDDQNIGSAMITSTVLPKLMTNLPYGEQDDFRQGRSCFYRAPNRYPRMPLRGKDPWACQECVDGKCRPLQRRGRCPPFRRMESDQVPRVMSEASPLTNQKSHTLVFHHDSHASYAQHETPACTGTLSLPCFNLARCSRYGPIKVFPYGKAMEELVDFAVEQTKGVDAIQKANSSQDACLLVIGPGSFETPQQLLENKYWNGGQNHYIFNTAYMFDTHGDRPFNTECHFGMAATSQISMDDAYNREGYDTPLGLYPKWHRPAKYDGLDIHRKRRLLLSFRGNIYNWEQRFWQHRWIASEYWQQESDVHVDTRCSKKVDYEETDPQAYEELLMNSTFVFCPGGGGANSYRFPETLAADAIPVVTSDFLAPFHPDIDWSNCIVRVSEARVVNIPNIVRSIPEEEVRSRRQHCKMLSEKVFGSDVKQHFTVAMQVWAIRINGALRKKFEILDNVLA